jgi:bifunctional non-homologous end joining protein LigD
MIAFDLLYLIGYNLRKLRLIGRKALLKTLVDKNEIQFSESFEITRCSSMPARLGLEGVVSKVCDAV